jgi:hypothetical protein
MNYPQIGSIYLIKGQISYVFHCDGIFRINAISKDKDLKSGWFQNGEQQEIPLTQEWLDLLKSFDPDGYDAENSYKYDLNSDYLRHWNYKTLNDYLLKQYSMKNIYDFEVKQDLFSSCNNIFIYAKLKTHVFEKICSLFKY